MRAFLNAEIDRFIQSTDEYNQKARQFTDTLSRPEIRNIIRQEELRTTAPEYRDGKLSQTVLTKEERPVVNLSLDHREHHFKVNDDKFRDYEAFFQGVIRALETADTRTEEEIAEAEAKKRITAAAADPAFNAFLRNNGLTIAREPRETVHYYYFDLTRSDGTHIGSLAVQKQYGEIYLMDEDDVMISSLRRSMTSNMTSRGRSDFSLPDDLSQYNNLDTLYSRRGSTTFLLAGTHEKQVDTILLAHADRSSDRITLIGVPRDIWYENRKINSYYLIYGPERFVNIVGEVTGLDIDGYIFIDMYAFIDTVNILGGVEVTLKEDLIDPYYPVRDNGRWSTLYYEAGTYNFNGIEALRVARSRGTSSDFDRSIRQQQILIGIQQRFQELNLTSTGKVYELMNTLFTYIDTDFSIVELVGHFLAYRNSEMSGRNVISMDNVLYTTYSNIHRLGEDEKDKQYEEGFNRGLWILLPKNDDWDLIRWYVRELISGNAGDGSLPQDAAS